MEKIKQVDNEGYLISKKEFDEKIKQAVPFFKDKHNLLISFGGASLKEIIYYEKEPKLIQEGVLDLGDEKTIRIELCKIKEILGINQPELDMISPKRKLQNNKMAEIYCIHDMITEKESYYFFHKSQCAESESYAGELEK